MASRRADRLQYRLDIRLLCGESEFSSEPRGSSGGDSTLSRRDLDIRRRKLQIRLGDGRGIRDTGERPLQEVGGIIGCLGCEWDLVGEEEYQAHQPPAKNERRRWKRGQTVDCYRRRCFRVPDLEHVWYTGSEQENHPALCDAKERVGKASIQNNMGADKFEKLLRPPINEVKGLRGEDRGPSRQRFLPLAQTRTLGFALRGRGGGSGEKG